MCDDVLAACRLLYSSHNSSNYNQSFHHDHSKHHHNDNNDDNSSQHHKRNHAGALCWVSPNFRLASLLVVVCSLAPWKHCDVPFVCALLRMALTGAGAMKNCSRRSKMQSRKPVASVWPSLFSSLLGSCLPSTCSGTTSPTTSLAPSCEASDDDQDPGSNCARSFSGAAWQSSSHRGVVES
eukprot:m.242236 g.242236  ORF g.242236 m.242236 type:complete len:181 (+) comp54437_c0_seq3:518-1060(+)